MAIGIALGLLAVSCGGGQGAAESGIMGVVLLGPQCPVVQQGSPCPDEPFEGTVSVTTVSGRLVGTTRSGPDGRFDIRVEPGTYLVTALNLRGVMFAKPVTVDVTSGRMSEVSVVVDTGIRGPAQDSSSDY